jgi:UDP-N-acetylglucosamine 2-epimerase (non-hydrolysing)
MNRSSQGRVAVVLGTRPEIVKLAGVIDALGSAAAVVHSGQHYDPWMSQVFFDRMGLPRPEHQLALGGLSRADQIGRGVAELGRLFDAIQPNAVVVQGDTNSALAGALAANAVGSPLVHVEAGLRSFDRAMPEEHNRVLIDHIADLLAAPTSVAVDNLTREGISGDAVLCCGNTVVEAVRRQLPPPATRLALVERYGLQPGGYVLATIHRPENTDDPMALQRIVEQLGRLPMPVLAPLHPRTTAAIAQAGVPVNHENLRLVAPLAGDDFLALAAEAGLLVSDSGGIQEEATVLGRPLLVVRRSTERPEALADFATLVRPEEIGSAAAPLLADLPAVLERLALTPSPYGDGSASNVIVKEILCRYGPARRALLA